MSPDIIQQLIARLAPNGYSSRNDIEAKYPPRSLSPEALVTRVAPSPTGFVHLGTVYAALINYRLANQSSGVFILRIEDTDKKREVEGAKDLIIENLDFFGLQPNERPSVGDYGPYIQSERANLYLGFAVDLLKNGRAYPCFATPEELEASYQAQTARKLRPGYYGEFALWRDRPEADIAAALKEGQPFVLRFKSVGSHNSRIKFNDELKGLIEMPENDLDVPLIKSDGLPTYHLAHVVDDYLMRVNLVLRGDEWLPSTSLHLELCQALGIESFRYAHFAPLSISDNGNKRKLSKRKDPQADIKFWREAGYPAAAILEYLTNLASSDFEAWRSAHPTAALADFPLSLKKLAMSRAPLLDQQKIDHISQNVIAELPQDQFEASLMSWLENYDQKFLSILKADPYYTDKVLAIERSGDKKRKDFACWSQASDLYGYFFDEIFSNLGVAINQELDGLDVAQINKVCQQFLSDFNYADSQEEWLHKMRHGAEQAGYAADNKAYQQNPEGFAGSFADYVKVIRVKLTGRNRTPDLYLVMQAMGHDRVHHRLAE